ncbi:YoaK family protein [Ancylobacter sp. FA202]|uniref:YoaK family protein n=1 Tax=Ancylobacter sp. FA202 TaxID=1111106 RepID=UPI000370EC97|nr:YoaK family protein [Ancylobacter sp. FA202]
MKYVLPGLLCFNAGFVDTAGFVTLHGLFTAHVTGNIVTFAAALAEGHMPSLSKIIAVPVFCFVVVAARLVSRWLVTRGYDDFRILMAAKLILLAHAALVAIQLGAPLAADTPNAIMMGMTLVSAMALQNALHRTHLTDAPPSTVMTGTITQLLLDLTHVWKPHPGAEPGQVRERLRRFGVFLASFAAGCAMAALLYLLAGMWCFLLPPLVALVEIYVLPVTPEPAAPAKGKG